MTTVIALHEVADVSHWLHSPRRGDFFNARGMKVATFVSPSGGNRVGVVIEDVPSLDALNEALQSPEAVAAMRSDGVRPDTIELFVAS